MVELANEIKEKHMKQKQNEKERESTATGNNDVAEPIRNYGTLLTMYNPNKSGKKQAREAVYIELGKDGKMLDMNAMDEKYKDPEERHQWKTQPKGLEMKKLVDSLRLLTSTNWDSTVQALCGKLSMHHRSMWVAFYLLQASECLDPEQLEIVSPHLMSMDTVIFELLTDHCPKEAKSELDNFTQVRRRKLFSNTRGIALLCLVVQTLGCSMPGKPEQKLESINLNLSSLCEDVTAFSESLDRINTQFEQHGPDAAECERLCKPVVKILLHKKAQWRKISTI